MFPRRRAFSRTKPIVAYKAGRFAQSAAAAASHTGAMAGVDSVYAAAFQRAGIERIFQFEDMFDCAGLLARHQPPKGDRVAIVTNAGGPGVMTTDHLLSCDGTLAKLSQETIDKLNKYLPAFWSHGNPVDILGDAPPDRYAGAVEIVLQDPRSRRCPGDLDSAVDDRFDGRPPGPRSGRRQEPEAGAGGLDGGGAPWPRARGSSTRRAFPPMTPQRRPSARSCTWSPTPRTWKPSMKRRGKCPMVVQCSIGSAFGSCSTPFLTEGKRHPLGGRVERAVGGLRDSGYQADGWPPRRRSRELGKADGLSRGDEIHSPQITHKTEAGGVVLNLASDEAVAKAFKEMTERAQAKRPDATILGVTVQKMVAIPNAFELIVGMKKDPVFGAVILVGMGGTATEVFQDLALALPPLNETLARRAIESLKSWKLLRGFRGKPAVNVDRLIEVLMRFSYLIADYPEIYGDGRESAAWSSQRSDRPGRPGGDRPGLAAPLIRKYAAPGDPALSGRIRARAETQGRLGPSS